MAERWLPTSEFPESYEVSSLGRVRRVATGRVLRQQRMASGYMCVTLSILGVHHTRYVHRLVASAFLGGPPHADAHVRHWNGTPADNRPSNLRWGTAAQNAQDRARHGTHYSHFRGVTHCIRNHEFTPENTRVKPNGRSCKACEVLHTRNYRARLRGN